MKKNYTNVLVLVASNFEDIELIAVVDLFSRENIRYQLVSIENKTQVKGKYNAIVNTKPLAKINTKDFNAIFLPGGPGTNLLIKNPNVIKIIQEFKQDNKFISAICAAPEVLVKANVIETNQKITSFPGTAKTKNNTGKKIESYPMLVTGRDYEVSIEFAKEVLNQLKSLK